MSGVFSVFKFNRDFMQNVDSGIKLPYDKFFTKKNEFSSRLLKNFSKMSRGDLNKFVDKYSKPIGVNKNTLSNDIAFFTPKFSDRKDVLLYDNKFVAKTTIGKKVKISKIHIDKDLKVNVINDNDNLEYREFIKEQAIKLNNGELTSMEIDPTKMNLQQLFEILKLNVIDKKVSR